jgi:prepilin-type N-terminal cleavage/methylation domain-containing protein
MAGFTLLELIVAAGILALIAVFSWRGLDALVREREAIAASQVTIDGLQRAFARLERDALSASDAELDGAGDLQLVAGLSSVEGTPAATVAYRFADGRLTRSVVGVDRAPLVLLDGIPALSMEAWQPGPRGGAWVRIKGPAMEVPVARAAGSGIAPPVNLPLANATSPSDAQQPLVVNQPSPPSPQAAAAAVAPATGIRVTFLRADGQPVVRAFMVGGG